jgi:hypothetical protein
VDAALHALKARLDEIDAARQARLKAGEVISAVEAMNPLRTDADWDLLWPIVRALRRDHPTVAVKFPENTLAATVVDLVREADDGITLTALAETLDELAASEGPWLVSTPLANIELTEPLIKLADDAALLRAIPGTDWLDDRSGGHGESGFEMQKLLGDYLNQVTEWAELDNRRFNTGRGASLLTVEEGTAPLALPRARARTQYALSVWAVLSPPSENQLLPEIGIWIPQPNLRWAQRYKRKEDDVWPHKEGNRGGGIWAWAPYRAPAPDVLRVPFEAMAAREHRSAQALLSSAHALVQGGRRSRVQLSEEIRGTIAAIELLCEREPLANDAFDRWTIVAERLGVWEKAGIRGYAPEDIADLHQRLRFARNVATHGADAVLLDLGYPEDAERRVARRKNASGTDFAFAALAADLEPLRSAVRHVVRELFALMRASNWDDDEFEAQFN